MTTETKDIQVTRQAESEQKAAGAMTPRESLEGAFDALFEGFGLRPWRSERPFAVAAPRLDVIDKDDHIIVQAELPGVRKEDVEISLSDRLFTIKGEIRRDEEKKDGDFYRRERIHGRFSRTIPLPVEVDEEDADAKLDNGLLEVRLHKTKRARKRSIRIH